MGLVSRAAMKSCLMRWLPSLPTAPQCARLNLYHQSEKAEKAEKAEKVPVQGRGRDLNATLQKPETHETFPPMS
ncbi:MAG: hypothetical protein AAGA95_03535 [Pseudomonadota bacterium]